MGTTPPDDALGPLEAKVGMLLERLDCLVAEVEELKAQSRSLRTTPPPVAPARASQVPAPGHVDEGDGREALSRRRLLLGGAGVAAGGAAALGGGGGSGGRGQRGRSGAWQHTNSANRGTGIAVSGGNVSYGLGVTDNGYSGSGLANGAIFGHAKNTAFASAAQLLAEGSAGGLVVSSVDGDGINTACGGAGRALIAFSGSGQAGLFSNNAGDSCLAVGSAGPGLEVNTRGDGHQLRLHAEPGWNIPAPPATSLPRVAGDVVVDTDGVTPHPSARAPRGNLWFCVADGAPGTWRKVAGPATAGAFHVLKTPVRVYDSRPGTSPPIGPKTPLAANTPRALDLTANTSGVPSDATAALVNLLLVNTATGSGNFTIWANGVARPAANNMVWGGSAGRFSSMAVTALGASAHCQVQSSLRTDFVLDVVGYYR
ncbi:MAG: hypothetical protein JWN46_3996 [Acidimicrobiales bacterium]|nr:hypothetical protein [Acidimicrobiales bacterium]